MWKFDANIDESSGKPPGHQSNGKSGLNFSKTKVFFETIETDISLELADQEDQFVIASDEEGVVEEIVETETPKKRPKLENAYGNDQFVILEDSEEDEKPLKKQKPAVEDKSIKKEPPKYSWNLRKPNRKPKFLVDNEETSHDSVYSLEQDKDLASEEDFDDSRKLICNLCGFQTKNYLKFDQHVASHSNGAGNVKSKKPSNSTSGAFSCNVNGCSKILSSAHEYNLHKRSHFIRSKEIKKSKSTASKVPAKSTAPDKGLRSKKKPESPKKQQSFKCNRCIKSFNNEIRLKIHNLTHK